MSKQPPKNNFVQTLLWASVLFLGFQLFMNRNNSNSAEGPKADELYAKVIEAAKGRKEVTLANAKTAYEKRLDFDLQTELKTAKSAQEKKALEEATAEKKMEADVLLADTQLKVANYLNNSKGYDVVTTAYQTMKGLERANLNKPIWNKSIKVYYTKDIQRDEVTPKQLLAEITANASRLGKDTPVWGFFPGYQVVDFLVKLTGANPHWSYWLAALFMAIVVRGAIFHLFQKQLMWGRQMAQLTPLTAELKEKYQGQELQQKIMELYKEYGINPMAGCFPVVIQMPFFLLIYASMLHYRFEFEKGVFMWVGSGLAERFPGIVARNLGERDYPMIVIYALTMLITQLLTPVSDPSNAKQQRLMGISMTLMFGVMMFFWPIPSAFVVYWIFLNILASAQSLRAYRLPPPPLVKVNAPGGGVFPTNGKPVARFGSTGAPKVHRAKKKK